MNVKKKYRMDYRYYKTPPNIPVIALTGEEWIRYYGNDIDYLHFHNYLEIGICIFGDGEMIFKDTSYPYHGGMITVIPKNYPHTTNSKEGEKSYWEYLFVDVETFLEERYRENPEMVEKIMNRISERAFIKDIKDVPKLAELSRYIMDTFNEKAEMFEDDIKGALGSLIINIVRLNKKDENSKSNVLSNKAILPAIEYINKNYSSQIEIEDLAKLCMLSESHFRRLFKNIMEMTPTHYINKKRVIEACKYLKNTDANIAQIALKVGFITPSTFNRNFQKFIGTSPKNWRKKPEHYERILLEYNIKANEGW